MIFSSFIFCFLTKLIQTYNNEKCYEETEWHLKKWYNFKGTHNKLCDTAFTEKRNTGLPAKRFFNVCLELQNFNQKNVFLRNKIRKLWNSCRKCTQPACDVPGASSVGPLKVLISWTSRGLFGDQQKNWWFKEKKCFLDPIVLVLHVCYCFLLKKQRCKSSKWDVHGMSKGHSCGMSRGSDDGTFWGHARDVGHTCFLNSTQKH